MPEPSRWPEGAADIEYMVERGELEHVAPSTSHADHLLTQADQHLTTAEAITATDPPSAFILIYDGARKAMTAALAKQGLRPTRAGGHLAVQNATEAQLGKNTRHLVRAFRGLRRRRNEIEYPSPDTLPVSENEASAGLQDARRIVGVMRKLLPLLGPFQP